MTVLTNEIYRASRDPRIIALQSLKTADGRADVGARSAAALPLHQAGLVIDEGIDLYGLDPVGVMTLFASHGFGWHEAAFQQQPPLEDYRDLSKAWPGSIVVSLDAADYPPFAKPAPPEPEQSPVGGKSGVPGVYSVNTPVFYKNGMPQYSEGSPSVAANGDHVTAHYGPSGLFFGWSWEDAAARTKRVAAGA